MHSVVRLLMIRRYGSLIGAFRVVVTRAKHSVTGR